MCERLTLIVLIPSPRCRCQLRPCVSYTLTPSAKDLRTVNAVPQCLTVTYLDPTPADQLRVGFRQARTLQCPLNTDRSLQKIPSVGKMTIDRGPGKAFRKSDFKLEESLLLGTFSLVGLACCTVACHCSMSPLYENALRMEP